MCDKVIIIVFIFAGLLSSVLGTFFLLRGIWPKGFLLRGRGSANKFFRYILQRFEGPDAPEPPEPSKLSWWQVDEILGAVFLVLGFIVQLFNSILSTYCAGG